MHESKSAESLRLYVTAVRDQQAATWMHAAPGWERVEMRLCRVQPTARCSHVQHLTDLYSAGLHLNWREKEIRAVYDSSVSKSARTSARKSVLGCVCTLYMATTRSPVGETSQLAKH
eukprot:6208430-Pleurochrysis_carterae.AAC.1